MGAADLWEGCENDCLGQGARRACRQGGGALGAGDLGHRWGTGKPFADVGLVDDPDLGAGVIADRNQNAPCGRATEIAACAINRIENPRQAGCALFHAVFFAENGVVGAFAVQNLAHGAFGGAVCLGHWVKPACDLVVRSQIDRPKMPECFGTRSIGKQMGDPQQIAHQGCIGF